MPNDGATPTKDYVIVGAGPAGVQLGYFLEQAGRDYVVLEAEDCCGAFFRRFPRHRTLISINKIYSGYDQRELQLRWDWNSLLGPEDDVPFSAYTREYFPPASALVGYLNDFGRRHQIKFQFRTTVRSIVQWTDSDGTHRGYHLTDQDGGVIRARRVIIASGYTKPNLPPIEGIELAEPYTTMSAEPEDFTDQRILIIGKGNSAFETADRLIPTARMIHLVSPEPVEFAWRSHFVGNLRAINNNFLDTYQLKSQNAVLDAHVDSIRRESDGYQARFRYIHNTEVEEITYDRILNCTGFRFDASIFDQDCQPGMRACGRLPLMDEGWESINLPDVYFAGVLTQVRDYRKSSSAFIHGFRYNARALFRLLEQKYENVRWPARVLETTPDVIADAMLERINSSSALWQQFGYLCDVVLKSEDGPSTYLEEMPIDYVIANPSIGGSDCFTVTLEYGPKRLVDPFDQTGRVVRTDASNAESSAFLHPVIRRYRAGVLIATHHVIEDLAAEWHESEHVEPLRDFLRAQLDVQRTPPHSDIRELVDTEAVARGKTG